LIEGQRAGEAPRVLVVGERNASERIDQFVAAALGPECSRSQVARMIKAGLVTVNGSAVRASATTRRGDRVEVFSPPQPEQLPPTADAPEIEVIFSDPELIAVNKPAGMTVHRAPGHPHSTLVDALLARFPDLSAMAEPEGIVRPGIVHRLDKDTSGVMVVARTPFAKMALSQQFKDRIVRKTYLAITQGIIGKDRFTVSYSVGRHPADRKRMSIRSHSPREALTDFLVLRRFPDSPLPATLVRARPHTGRTHQIRVHLAATGHPCLGDPLYGRSRNSQVGEEAFSRQALHALALSLIHPRENVEMEFIAPMPSDMACYLVQNGFEAGGGQIRQMIDV
jgi:23S rRNA pseudouridine1911/1915/1917 synthase